MPFGTLALARESSRETLRERVNEFKKELKRELNFKRQLQEVLKKHLMGTTFLKGLFSAKVLTQLEFTYLPPPNLILDHLVNQMSESFVLNNEVN